MDLLVRTVVNFRIEDSKAIKNLFLERKALPKEIEHKQGGSLSTEKILKIER